jgi:hypothetical protein
MTVIYSLPHLALSSALFEEHMCDTELSYGDGFHSFH